MLTSYTNMLLPPKLMEERQSPTEELGQELNMAARQVALRVVMFKYIW